MGVGWRPEHRKELLGPDGIVANGPVASADGAIVVDGPAVARMFMFNTSSPMQVAKMMLKRLFKGGLPCAISIMFDIAGNMPPARALVAAARKGPALTGEDQARIATFELTPFVPGHLHQRLPWDVLLRDSRAKAAIWEIMAKAIFDAVLAVHSDVSVEVVSAAERRTHAGHCPLPAYTGTGGYGEADILVARRVRDLTAAGFTCNVSTCDYDMVFQMMLSRESVVRYILFKNDTVDMEAVRARFCDCGRGASLSAAFFLLACFKSDYSKSISGPSKTRVAALMKCMHDAGEGRGDAAAVVEEGRDGEGNPVILFYPRVLALFVKKTSAAVATIVCNILWTLAYFGEYGLAQAAGTAPPPCTPVATFWELDVFTVPVCAGGAVPLLLESD